MLNLLRACSPRSLLALSLLAVVLGAAAHAAAPAAPALENEEAEKPAEEESSSNTVPAASGRPAPRRPTPRERSVAFDPDWLQPFFQSPRSPRLQQAASDFRQEQWGAAESGFLKGASRLPAGSEERQAARFLAALAKAHQGKWPQAAAAFRTLYREYPRLAPYHAYNAARAHLRDGEPEAALAWSAKVAPGSVPEAEAALVGLDALRALGRWSDAAVAAADFSSRFPQGPRRVEALFKQAEAREKVAASTAALEINADLADITALYRRVWTDAPLEDWSNRAAERLEAIATGLPPTEARLVRTRIASEWFGRGMVYFERNRNAESEAAFTSALSATGLDSDLECRARYHRAQSVWKQRQRPRAAPLFDEAEAACVRAGNRDLRAKALYQGARCLAASGNRPAAMARYARLEAEHVEHSYADDARLRAAELATDGGDQETANKMLAELSQKYPQGDLLGEALWRLAFAAWRAEKYPEAARWLDENLRRIPREEIWYAEGRALYWKARVLERQQDPAGAREYYARAIREYPLSVYALLAFGRLDRQGESQETRSGLLRELRPREKPVAFHFASRPLFGEPGFRRAVDLARMGQGGDARRELARLGLQTAGDKQTAGRDTRQDEEDLLWMTTVLLDKAGLWNASHSIPRYSLTGYRLEYPRGLGATKWRLAYPRAFPEVVAKNSAANQIPEGLQLAIMREESAFSPRIESFANAIGLTQMLVKTASRFSNGAKVTRESLMDPSKNLEYGSRFLGFLWNRFGKAAPLSIAGYNAGEGAVDRWLSDRGHLDMDEFMETVPYDETRNYTKRVLASYFAYSWLYDEKRPVPVLPEKARAR